MLEQLDVSKSAGGGVDDEHVDDRFRLEAVRVLGRFRQAMERLVYSLTKSLPTSRSLQTATGIDRHTSWQVFKLLGPIETLATISYIPAGVSLRRLVLAGKKRGITPEVLDEVGAAFAAFEQLVSDTTGDMEQFETAVMSYQDTAESIQAGMHHRRAAFKADYHFFGVAVDLLAHALIFHPGAKPGGVDFVGIRQMLGMRRLRANTDLVVDRWKINREREGQPAPSPLSDALDPVAAAERNAAVLPEFCTQPLVPLTTVSDESGDVRTLLRHRDIAVGQEVDITTARVYRNTMFCTDASRPAFHGLTEIARPTRLQVLDTFVHRPTWPNLVPYSGIYAHLPTRLAAKAEQEGVRLPFHEKLTRMGSGPDVLRIGESPRYPDLVRYACRKLGWEFDDFELYRIRLEYPLMDSNILCRFHLA